MNGPISLFRRRFSQDGLFWICAATVLVLIPLLLVIAWASIESEHAREDAERTTLAHSYERRAEIQTVALMLKDAESSQRGYVITGDRAFLRRHDMAAAAIDAELAHLRQIFAGQPDQLERLVQLDAEAHAKFAVMAKTREVRDAQGLEAAAAVVRARSGEILMERLRTITDAMSDAEAVRLQQSQAREARETRRSRLITTSSFALVLLSIIAAGVMAFRYTLLRTSLISRARAEADRRQAIFDSAMDAIITLNPSGGIESINKAAERMFGYTPPELVGRDIATLVPLAPGEEGLFLDRVAAQGLRDGDACQFDARRRDGSTFPIDVNLGEMMQPDGPHLVTVMRDCTERKRADLAKDEFVSTVSHELRTPLTSIAGSLGLLMGGAAGALSERGARLVSIAESNSRRLVRLINDILDMEKIQSGNLVFQLQPLDLGDLVGRALESVSGMASEFNVAFDYTPPAEPVTVRGDADRLMQVLTNLLSNAAKFSPDGGEVEIGVETVESTGRVWVRDHGPGVPPEFHDRIFGKFAQADSSDTRQKGGTGLGLAITREIVERHGGRIWFDSQPGDGATFTVQLPLDTALAIDPTTAGPRLLLCEDDADVAQVLGEALRMQGFHLDVARSLAEAELALARGGYEALLLDLRLPDGNGMDLLQKLRESPETRSLPVIVVSADPSETAAGAFDLVDWLQKPVDLNRLRFVLQQVMGEADEQPIVLHVDDDPDLRLLVMEAFAGRGRLMAAGSLAEARNLLATITPQLVILDVGLPDGSGLDLLPSLVDKDGAALPVVIFSAQSLENATLTDAVDAVLTKSRTSLGQLAGTVRRLHRARQRRAADASA
jgi:PAS domain S-box-containing protein